MFQGNQVLSGVWVLLSLVLASGHSAQADYINPFQPICGSSGRSDSFGRGIKDQVQGTRSPMKFESADAHCYSLGQQHAATILASEGGADSLACKSDFQGGFAEGMKASSHSAGTGCYNLGYAAGRSDLRIATATGDIRVCGRECRKNYCQGLKDWNDSVAPELSSSLDEKQQSCYQHGYFDGPVVRYLCR